MHWITVHPPGISASTQFSRIIEGKLIVLSGRNERSFCGHVKENRNYHNNIFNRRMLFKFLLMIKCYALIQPAHDGSHHPSVVIFVIAITVIHIPHRQITPQLSTILFIDFSFIRNSFRNYALWIVNFFIIVKCNNVGISFTFSDFDILVDILLFFFFFYQNGKFFYNLSHQIAFRFVKAKSKINTEYWIRLFGTWYRYIVIMWVFCYGSVTVKCLTTKIKCNKLT